MSVINWSAPPVCTLASVSREESQEYLPILYSEDASSVVSGGEEQELEREVYLQTDRNFQTHTMSSIRFWSCVRSGSFLQRP